MADHIIVGIAIVALLRFTWDHLISPIIVEFVNLHQHFKGPPKHQQAEDDTSPRVGFFMPTDEDNDE